LPREALRDILLGRPSIGIIQDSEACADDDGYDHEGNGGSFVHLSDRLFARKIKLPISRHAGESAMTGLPGDLRLIGRNSTIMTQAF
jgi:hypothetical protein